VHSAGCPSGCVARKVGWPASFPRFASDAAGTDCSLADHVFGQGGVMRRCPVRVPAPRSGFAGFRFPREVIVLAVRWYLSYGLSYGAVNFVIWMAGMIDGALLG